MAGRSSGLACIGLIAAVFAVFAQVAGHEFFSYETDKYLTGNPWVLRGLSWEGLREALLGFHAATWQPLTWLSHMLDVQVFGLRPSAHHLVNVVIHAANACLVLLVLFKMTGDRGESLFVAAVFALHPLRVESVAWVVERKDLLSAFFGLLCLWCWVDWARPRPHEDRRRAYLASLVFLAAGLMSHAILVTWPFVLLLLDIWPLARTKIGARRRLLEKLPFFALAAVASALTFLAQNASGAVQDLDKLSISARLSNAALSYTRYLGQIFWPSELTFYYPYPGSAIPGSHIAVSASVLALVSAAGLVLARRAPWILVGWLYFLGTLVPMIGLVQVGGQSSADRFTYLPLLGIAIALAWTAGDAVRAHPRLRAKARGLALTACAMLGFVSWHQAGHWKDTETLCNYALALDGRNHVAHDVLGADLVKQDRLKEAAIHLRKALRIAPGNTDAILHLAIALEHLERREEAEATLRRAVTLAPASAPIHAQLASVLHGSDRLPEALSEADEAVRLDPDDPGTHFARARVLEALRRPSEARASLERALEIAPTDAAAHLALARLLTAQAEREPADREFDAARRALDRALAISNEDHVAHGLLGLLHLERGAIDTALVHLREAVRIAPGDVDSLANLGRALYSRRRFAEAEKTWRHALSLVPDRADIHGNLALVLRAGGRPKKALAEIDEVLRIAPRLAAFHSTRAQLLEELARPDDARAAFERALEIQPDLLEARLRLARVLARTDDLEGAECELRRAVADAPQDPEARRGLALVLIGCGRLADALPEACESLRLKPGWALAMGDLAWILARGEDRTLRDPGAAVEWGEQAAKATEENHAGILDSLAAAYAAQDRFDLAVATAGKALDLALKTGDDAFATRAARRLVAYKERKIDLQTPR